MFSEVWVSANGISLEKKWCRCYTCHIFPILSLYHYISLDLILDQELITCIRDRIHKEIYFQVKTIITSSNNMLLTRVHSSNHVRFCITSPRFVARGPLCGSLYVLYRERRMEIKIFKSISLKRFVFLSFSTE